MLVSLPHGKLARLDSTENLRKLELRQVLDVKAGSVRMASKLCK